jgi:hypothetical protein
MNDMNSTPNPFSVRTITIMLTVAIISFASVLALSGWAPELRRKDTAGPHPFSTSSLGFQGLVRLLEARGDSVSVSQHSQLLATRTGGLMIITLPPYGTLAQLDDPAPSGRTLIVLPKWDGQGDPFNIKRQGDTDILTLEDVQRALIGLEQISGMPVPDYSYDAADDDVDAIAATDTQVSRMEVSSSSATRFGDTSVWPDLGLQTITSSTLLPVIAHDGKILLAKTPYADTYILTDPDVFHTFGLARYENAALATRIIDYVRGNPAEPIYLDASLHGFELSNNLLKMAFDIPFLGATLIGMASALLLGWAALVRFGSAAREERVIALGKQALADNSAALFTMARREKEIAKGYLSLIRRRAARDVNAPRSLQESGLSALFDKLGPEKQSGKSFSQLEAGFDTPLGSRDDMMNKARALFRWRRDVIGSKLNADK